MALTPRESALRYVAALAAGPPLAPGLRVTLNFHPGRTAGGKPVLDRLADDGVYLSQFSTGTSNGGLTAHPGGDRWRWESRIFGGAYDQAPPHERPVYGALDFRRDPYGAARRFGSAHLRLAAHTLDRTTFCYPDSVFQPADFGVAAAMSLTALADADARDALDDYVEAQVHGPVVVAGDVEAVVLDPVYQGTPVEAAAARLRCPVEWHGGFRLSVEELAKHPGYRGPEHVELGTAIAVDGWLDPGVLDEAVGAHDPQALKRVWHCLARFGAPTPVRPGAAPPGP
ncbi:DUF3626 domain-containing protein [Phytomonospora endophytica]|uniref:DUF3626 domain-containing protein n=1 Tax=Phytomonospora endophytica TaxID=714109 RepID=A0A841FMX7_9ACTN|nr:DUF3626 domain-containing protein [Phytomonospora endophytica]MBB6037466.1 hypothetical protein [Phytomonospora endophytica]GIG70716.1 hypothetical protein Pen01_70110 [Phytomonospora endophytica]